MKSFFKSILRIIFGVAVAGLLFISPVYPLALHGAAQLLASDERTEGVYALDFSSPEVSAVAVVTLRNYVRNVLGMTTTTDYRMFIPGQFKYFVLRGEIAKDMSDKCGCFGMTSHAERVVFILDVPGSDWQVVLSHELVHVLQFESGMFLFTSREGMELQPEAVSRWTIGFLDQVYFPVERGIRDMTDEEAKISNAFIFGMFGGESK